MVSFTVFPITPVDRWFAAGVRSRRTPFPVARRMGRQARGGDVHLVDGDGASLCEAVTQQQLERLPLAWADVVPVARCRGCEVLGCSSVPDVDVLQRDRSGG